MAHISDANLAAPALRLDVFAQAPASRRSVQNRPTSQVCGPVRFEIVRDLAGFDGLEAEWRALESRCGRPEQLFQTFNWNWHWAATFLDKKHTLTAECSIAILIGRSDQRLVTLWPLVLERRGLLLELAWMGEPVSQYGDVLVDPRVSDTLAVLRAGWTHLIAALRPDLARLRKVRADATIQPLLAELASLHTSELEAPYIDLSRFRDFAEYEGRFAKRALRNRRRQLRRLEEAGAVRFRHLDPSPDAANAAAAGIDMKRRWLIDRGHVSPALADVRMARFMTAVATLNDHPTGTRVATLDCGDRTAAVQIGFTSGQTRILHVIAYDRTFDRMAAGVLHLEEAVRHGFAEGLARIDLLAPKAEYKTDWADGTVGVVDHAIGFTPAGKIYSRLYLGKIRPRLKALIEHLPLKARQILVASHLKTAARRMMAVFGLS